MSLRWRFNRLLVRCAARCLKATGWYDGYWNHWRGEAFEALEREGLHVLPVHFYTPIPVVSALPADGGERESALPGIDLRLEQGFERLRELGSRYRHEYEQFPFEPTADAHRFHLGNSAYGPGDAEILYALVRDLRPRRIIEIGAGYTTLVIAEALRRNAADEGRRSDFLSIEPHPPDWLRPGPAELDRMLATPLQEVPLATFEALEAGDLLFIDSSHVVKTGSDVVYEFLEILPRLAPGVFVHVHDIYLPRDYPRKWLEESRFFWNEQYLLQAFLSGHSGFEVVLATNALYRADPGGFAKEIPSCGRHGAAPSSFWMQSRLPLG